MAWFRRETSTSQLDRYLTEQWKDLEWDILTVWCLLDLIAFGGEIIFYFSILSKKMNIG